MAVAPPAGGGGIPDPFHYFRRFGAWIGGIGVIRVIRLSAGYVLLAAVLIPVAFLGIWLLRILIPPFLVFLGWTWGLATGPQPSVPQAAQGIARSIEASAGSRGVSFAVGVVNQHPMTNSEFRELPLGQIFVIRSATGTDPQEIELRFDYPCATPVELFARNGQGEPVLYAPTESSRSSVRRGSVPQTRSCAGRWFFTIRRPIGDFLNREMWFVGEGRASYRFEILADAPIRLDCLVPEGTFSACPRPR